MSEHETQADYICPICHWTVMPQIPHECNYNLCHQCKGKGRLGWRDLQDCSACGGTGNWTNAPEEGEGELIG